MAKSIRSKSRRKSRSEFRKTIGTVAYNESMAKIQEKLKESLEKQNSMTSMDRLAKTLGTSLADGVAACVNNDNSMIMEVDDNNNNGNNNNGNNISDNKNAIDACDSMTPKIAVVEEKEQQQEEAPLSFKGENKAVVRGKKWKKNKLAIASLQKKQQSSGTTRGGGGSSSSRSSRPKPRFFCQF